MKRTIILGAMSALISLSATTAVSAASPDAGPLAKVEAAASYGSVREKKQAGYEDRVRRPRQVRNCYYKRIGVKRVVRICSGPVYR